MKLAIVVGTRPEIIKMAPIIRECEKNNIDFFILHTGQHYSPEMDKVFFEDLELINSKYNLGIGNVPYNKQVGKMVLGSKEVLQKEMPDLVVVQGDTTSVLSVALAANKLGIKVAHLEAGLRSYDLGMIEEINRITTDHISDFLFTPTKRAEMNLLEEGYTNDNIFTIGNSVVDAVLEHIMIANNKSSILEKLSLVSAKYFLVTMHRPENVDYKQKLEEFIRVLEMLKYKYSDFKIVLSLHPRTEKMISAYNLTLPTGIEITRPLSYLDFLALESKARLIITDSGGVQEEACILKIPCIIMRNNTERPESVELGMSVLSGLSTTKIDSAINSMLLSQIKWSNPYGEGNTANQMINILKEKLSNKLL